MTADTGFEKVRLGTLSKQIETMFDIIWMGEKLVNVLDSRQYLWFPVLAVNQL